MPAHEPARVEAIFRDKVMVVEVYKSQADGRSLYDAARYAWRANLRRTENVDYVLAVKNREIIGCLFQLNGSPPPRTTSPDSLLRRPNALVLSDSRLPRKSRPGIVVVSSLLRNAGISVNSTIMEARDLSK